MIALSSTLVLSLRRLGCTSSLHALAMVQLYHRGPHGMSALAAALETTAASANATVDKLEELGLARRTPSQVDGRRVVADLSPQGRALCRDHLPTVTQGTAA